ncbi:TPA: NAD-dependent epimerase/dehydratase family protein, partial [Yersinia enterocolitica]|nr:NAD-dependent epimerase/dehydratase family protein [Yersinia enterocolitica]
MYKKRVYIAGHNGMVGSAIFRKLQSRGNVELVTCDRKKLDLTSQASVQDFFSSENIDEIYLAAAKVGGIYANNTYPAEFIYE